MLTISFTEASRFQNALLTKDVSIQIKKRIIFIGRGQELQQKQSQTNGIIDLSNFDNTLSRVHASLNFSPSWFTNNQQQIPKYLSLITSNQQTLPADVVAKIWQFLKPIKKCIVKDLKSKVGIFKKIDQQQIQSQMIIQFVHQSFIKFQYYEQYESFQQLKDRIYWYLTKQETKYFIFGDLNKIKEKSNEIQNSKDKFKLLKIWHLTIKQTKFILLIQQNLILRIGRSSHCQIQIKDTAISRYQAYLKCQNSQWKIIDGNQVQRSKNGTWKKQKFIEIPISQNQDQIIKSYIKIGTIKCEIQCIKKFTWLNIEKISKGDVSKSFISIGIENNENFVANEQNVMEQIKN